MLLLIAVLLLLNTIDILIPLFIIIIFTNSTLSKPTLQIEYFAYGVEDFALYLPSEIIPSRRVLVLRYKNRFDTLVKSLRMRDIQVTSAYPVTWMRKEWSPQEERIAKEVDGGLLLLFLMVCVRMY